MHRIVPKRGDLFYNAIADKVVAEKQNEFVVANVRLRNLDAVRDAARLVLQDIIDTRAKPRTIADCRFDLVASLRRNDDANIPNARLHQIFNRVE